MLPDLQFKKINFNAVQEGMEREGRDLKRDQIGSTSIVQVKDDRTSTESIEEETPSKKSSEVVGGSW